MPSLRWKVSAASPRQCCRPALATLEAKKARARAGSSGQRAESSWAAVATAASEEGKPGWLPAAKERAARASAEEEAPMAGAAQRQEQS